MTTPMHESVMAHPHCQEEPQSLSKDGKRREDFLGPKENLFTALLLVSIKKQYNQHTMEHCERFSFHACSMSLY